MHDWLVVYAGAEKVLEQMLEIWPDADVLPWSTLARERPCLLKGKKVNTSFIQKLPLRAPGTVPTLPFMPLAIEQPRSVRYDPVVSSSHAVAKGVLTSPSQVHVSCVHSPIRYAWDLQHQYLRESGLTKGLKSLYGPCVVAPHPPVGPAHSQWRRCDGGPTRSLWASAFARCMGATRKWFTTGRHHAFHLRADKEDFYLTASRMVPHKMIPAIVGSLCAHARQETGGDWRWPRNGAHSCRGGPQCSNSGAPALFHIERPHAKGEGLLCLRQKKTLALHPLRHPNLRHPVIAHGRGGALKPCVLGG